MKTTLSALKLAVLGTLAAVAATYPVATLCAAAARVQSFLTTPLHDMKGQLAGVLTLTDLIPTIYNAMDVVSREMTGFIRAVATDSRAERAAVGEVVMSPVVGAMAAEDLVASNVPGDTPNQTIGNVQMTIQKARSVPFGITGEEAMGLNNAGTLGVVNRDRIAQALRTLGNEIEADLGGLHIHSSRAFGTAAGTPFGTANDLSDMAGIRRILTDNGAPASDLHLVNHAANVERMRGKQSNLFKVNEAGSDELLRTGNMGVIQGVAQHESAQVRSAVTVGTVSATVNNAGYAVGSTALTLSAAAVALLAGDIITIAGDSNKYVVAEALSGTGGVLNIASPGLRQAIPASTAAITVIAATNRSMAFHRSAIQLATRAPAMPPGGDMADDVTIIQDPVTGLAYEFAIYKGKRQVRYEVNLAWGVKMVAPRHAMLLLGA